MISISRTRILFLGLLFLEPVYQRQSTVFVVEKLGGRRGRGHCIAVVFCAEAEFQSLRVSGYARIRLQP